MAQVRGYRTYRNFENQLVAIVICLERVQNRRQFGGVELDYD